jgi:hypothetical protein
MYVYPFSASLAETSSIGEILEPFRIAGFSDTEAISDGDSGVVHMPLGTVLDKPLQTLVIFLRY